MAKKSTIPREIKKKRHMSFTQYFRHLTKATGNDKTQLSADTKITFVRFNEYLIERLMTRAQELCQHSKRTTLKADDLYAAVRMLFPYQLANTCVIQGRHATNAYARSYAKEAEEMKKAKEVKSKH
jgi:histone H3/H4